MNLHLAVLLCTASCLCCGVAASSWPPECCLKASNKRVHAKKIRSYTVYSAGLCPINAIAFWTKTGKKVCNDPDLDWVKNLMKVVGPKIEKRGTTAGPESSAELKSVTKKVQRRKGKENKKGKNGNKRRRKQNKQ